MQASTAATAASASSTRSKKGTSTGRPRKVCTMPRMSGQKGARISTSSPGSTQAPTVQARAPVAPAVTTTESGSHTRRLRARSFSVSASRSGRSPRGST